ncbi:MAG: InlB B-repeat-containing protein [Candidatus Enteromonas sp.]|nr:InlB B-repeat-containing protein [Candidatus Enteromonas sp.]
MKKNCLLLVGLFALGLASCGGTSEAGDASYTVEFDTQGLVSIASQTVKAGEKATEPVFSVPSGYSFLGWYADSAYQVSFDFDWAITADWTVYGHFETGESFHPTESSLCSEDSSISSESKEYSSLVSSENTTVSSEQSEEISTVEDPSLNRVYLHATSWWGSDGAIPTAHYWGSETTSWPGVTMNEVSGEENYYYVDVPAGIDGFVFARLNPSDNSVWNQTVDALAESGKNLYDISAGNEVNGKLSGTWSVYGGTL